MHGHTIRINNEIEMMEKANEIKDKSAWSELNFWNMRLNHTSAPSEARRPIWPIYFTLFRSLPQPDVRMFES